MPPRQSFARPDAIIRLYSRNEVAGALEWPGMLVREIDDAIVRQSGGIPQRRGDATYLLPLNAHAEGAGFARVRDIRTGAVQDYDVVEVDENPAAWTLRVVLDRRAIPIGTA